jgi:peptidoglycan hydrolase CwlO-like protein
MAKYLLITAVAISLITAGIGFVNHGTLTEAKDARDQSEAKAKTAQASATKAAGELKAAQTTLENVDAEKVKLAADLQAAEAARDTAQGKADEDAKTITAKDEEIAALKASGGQTVAHGETPVDVAGLQQKITDLENQNTELTAQVSSMNDRIAPLQASITDYKTKEQARTDKRGKQGLEGRVLAVNPAWNFVVLSIGDKQGVVNNSELLLKRGGQYLGKVRVTSVEPGTSIADIVANTLPAGIAVQPGDSVIYQSFSE